VNDTPWRGPGRTITIILAAAALAERWDGSTWRVQQVPGVAGGYSYAFRSVSCGSATACIAIGDGYSYPGPGARPAAASAEPVEKLS
jgi:hypothetical protein